MELRSAVERLPRQLFRRVVLVKRLRYDARQAANSIVPRFHAAVPHLGKIVRHHRTVAPDRAYHFGIAAAVSTKNMPYEIRADHRIIEPTNPLGPGQAPKGLIMRLLEHRAFIGPALMLAIIAPLFRAAEPLPTQISDETFWKMVTGMSEPDG